MADDPLSCRPNYPYSVLNPQLHVNFQFSADTSRPQALGLGDLFLLIFPCLMNGGIPVPSHQLKDTSGYYSNKTSTSHDFRRKLIPSHFRKITNLKDEIVKYI